jgi:hypothetical protein
MWGAAAAPAGDSGSGSGSGFSGPGSKSGEIFAPPVSKPQLWRYLMRGDEMMASS